MEQNGLPVSIVVSCKQYDSTKFVTVMESISEYLDDDSIKQTVRCYADKGYDAQYIREYLQDRKIKDCIPHRKNTNTGSEDTSYKSMERFVL